MSRSRLLICITAFALAPTHGSCQGQSTPAPTHDITFGARANPELGAADDPDLLKDPAYREAWQERHRQLYRGMYPDVGRVVQLSPTEERGLIELLVAQQLERIQQQLRGKSFQEQMARQEQQLAQYLGSERMETWRDYQMTAARRQSAERWREQIGGPDMLSDDQVEELARILRQAQEETNQPRPPPAGFPAITDHSPEAMRIRQAFAHGLIEQRDARVLELASPYLSARQLAALDVILSRHRFWQKPDAQPSSNSSAGARKL